MKAVADSVGQRDGIVPRLLRRTGAARYLSISVQQLDLLRVMGEVTPVSMPGRHGDARIPLFDIRDLDEAIERWKRATVNPINERGEAMEKKGGRRWGSGPATDDAGRGMHPRTRERRGPDYSPSLEKAPTGQRRTEGANYEAGPANTGTHAVRAGRPTRGTTRSHGGEMRGLTANRKSVPGADRNAGQQALLRRDASTGAPEVRS